MTGVSRLNRSAKLAPEAVRFLEAELSQYPACKTGLAQLAKDLAELAGAADWDGGAPELAAVRLRVLEKNIRERLARLRWIEAGLALLDPDQTALVEARYFRGGEATNQEICDQLGIGKDRFYELRRRILQSFAALYGLE